MPAWHRPRVQREAGALTSLLLTCSHLLLARSVKVLKTLGMLVAEGAIPLPMWPRLLDMVFQRLGDSSVMVQKDALKALQALIE